MPDNRKEPFTATGHQTTKEHVFLNIARI